MHFRTLREVLVLDGTPSQGNYFFFLPNNGRYRQYSGARCRHNPSLEEQMFGEGRLLPASHKAHHTGGRPHASPTWTLIMTWLTTKVFHEPHARSFTLFVLWPLPQPLSGKWTRTYPPLLVNKKQRKITYNLEHQINKSVEQEQWTQATFDILMDQSCTRSLTDLHIPTHTHVISYGWYNCV